MIKTTKFNSTTKKSKISYNFSELSSKNQETYLIGYEQDFTTTVGLIVGRKKKCKH